MGRGRGAVARVVAYDLSDLQIEDPTSAKFLNVCLSIAYCRKDQNKEKEAGGGGAHSTVDSILASRPAALGSILGVPKIFSEIISQKILDVVEINRQSALLRQWTVQ